MLFVNGVPAGATTVFPFKTSAPVPPGSYTVSGFWQLGQDRVVVQPKTVLCHAPVVVK